MNEVHQLVYLSAARQELGPEELAEILATARRANTAHDITGILLYSGGSFMQLLEGLPEEVGTTFERIGDDPRHHLVIPMLRRDVSRRAFADWSMAFPRVDPARAAELEGFSTFLESAAEPPAGTADHALRMLYGFRELA